MHDYNEIRAERAQVERNKVFAQTSHEKVNKEELRPEVNGNGTEMVAKKKRNVINI
jgi:hypothetical protein